jgi:hypothetical protein
LCDTLDDPQQRRGEVRVLLLLPAEADASGSFCDAPEAGARLAVVRPNALRSHGARPLTVLVWQLRNPISFGLDGAARVAGEQRRGASRAQSWAGPVPRA